VLQCQVSDAFTCRGRTPTDVDRRTLLTNLALSPMLLGQDRSTPRPTLYIPQPHVVEDRAFLHDFMEEFSFVDLVTSTPSLRITHVPVLLDRSAGLFGTIFGHVAAQNPQSQTFDGTHQAVVVFRGPHGYVSPTWYAKTDVVPTWNFAVVHACGRPKAITDRREARDLLARLIRKYEEDADYDLAKLPAAYVSEQIERTAPFGIEIEALEGKFKLGQERTAGDRQGILEHLRTTPYRERSLLQLTDSVYKRVAVTLPR
jgi:transcriptional regulator